ncbi:serine hydrolase [Occultella aeris]|uniref:serine hydrolase n=1 Tax=Occultella aeris TaxID=2761496 RepID=UPI0012EA2325|nr:serine hydrolase [Occultella aeris]
MRSTPEVLAAASSALEDAGLRGSLLVRDLDTGRELGLEPDLLFPLASLVKVPLALDVLELAGTGELDLDEQVLIDATIRVPGATGLCRFTEPASIALSDLLYLAVAVSDDTAAEALFRLCPPEQVTRRLRSMSITDVTVRHTIGELHRSLASRLDPADAHLAQTLAIDSATQGRGHVIPQLDVSMANSGSARAMADVFERIWSGADLLPGTADRLQELLAGNLLRHRLAPDLATDAASWASKTGTFLHLRHEVGVVTHRDGGRFVVAALTESRVPATTQPVAEQTIGWVARMLHDEVRGCAGPSRTG